MRMRAYGCMSLYLSQVLMLSHLIFPILPLLCSCFLQFLSTSFLLPPRLIRGTPQRWRIIPGRSSESFMSWEDSLARVLPALFPPLQIPAPASLPPSLPRSYTVCVFHTCLCSLSLWSPFAFFCAEDVTYTTSSCSESTNTTQTAGTGIHLQVLELNSDTDCCSALLWASGISEEPGKGSCFRGAAGTQSQKSHTTVKGSWLKCCTQTSNLINFKSWRSRIVAHLQPEDPTHLSGPLHTRF